MLKAIVSLFIAVSANAAVDRCIVYETEAGVSIVYPTEESGLNIQQVREKDVPSGVRSKIVPIRLIPIDRSRRNEWKYAHDKEGGISGPNIGAPRP